MNTPTRIGLDATVRGVVLVTGLWAFTKVWDAVTPGPHETDIGGGLAGLGLVVVAALVWERSTAGAATRGGSRSPGSVPAS